MGLRGPRPQPTALKIIKGNPGGRPLNDLEPKPEVCVPDAPEYLDETAKAHWDELTPILARDRVLTDQDRHTLGMMCVCFSKLQQAEVKIRELGMFVKGPNGAMENPYFKIFERMEIRYGTLAREFGMTPSARTRVHVQSKGESLPKSLAIIEAMQRRKA